MPGNDVALQALLRQVTGARGFQCDAYKESCLRRRLAVRMRACGVHTFTEYAEHLDRDTTEYDRLLDAMTINVTKFYRNADMWDQLATSVIPELLDRRQGGVRCWSAGCASGEEPYTLAVLLLAEAQKCGLSGSIVDRIDATDVDLGCLQKAEAGRYPCQTFDEMPDVLVRQYFCDPNDQSNTRSVSDRVRRAVRFTRHDVTREAPPDPPYDLILFRNVVIYFDRTTQERVFSQMVNALVPGGVLVLGKVETLCGAAREVLDLENARERVYRKP